MPRTAKKKVADTKSASKRRAGLSMLEKTEKQLKTAQAEFESQKERMRVVREKLRSKRVAAGKNASKTAKVMVDKAYSAVARNVVALDEAERKLHAARANVKIERLRQQVEDAELKAQEKVLAFERKLADRTEQELQSALEKFEARWRKKRQVLDAKKVRAAARAGATRVKTVAKKSASEIRTVERKVKKALDKPKKTAARPGRPPKVEGAAGAPKRRGRPPKAATATGQAAPKRRGRPPKAATAAKAAPKRRGRPAKAETTAAKAAPKRRGRPPKAETAAKAAPKRRGRPPKVATAAKAATPKRRGRPPKAATAAKAAPKRRGRPRKAG